MKKCKKRILFLFAFAIVLISVFTVGVFAENNAMSVGENEGLSFTGNERLHVSKTITEMPRTYEAVVHLDEDAPAQEGVIFGNYINYSHPFINFSLNASGAPKIYVNDSYVKSERQTTDRKSVV